MEILIDDKIPFIKGVFEPFADVVYLPGKEICYEKAKNADALIIRTRTKCNAQLLENTRIKFIASATIGFDHIDTQYCKINNIKWLNAPGCNASSVQQYIAMALLELATMNGIDLTQRTLGVVGVGNVGKKVVRLAELLGMRVILNDPPRARSEGLCGFMSLKGLLNEADIISFHTPLIKHGEDKSMHLANAAFFHQLQRGTIIINSSRGEVVNTNDLLKAFENGNVGHAVIDVWENEPEINYNLLTKVDIGTAHIAGYSTDGKANATKMCVQAVSKFFGLELNEWEVTELPQPVNTNIHIDGSGKSIQQVVYEALKHTYDINTDSELLRNNVSEFEALRGNYRIRREPRAYSLTTSNVDKQTQEVLRALGFN